MTDPLNPKSFKTKDQTSVSGNKSTKKKAKLTSNKKNSRSSAIPKEVANRMARRVAITTGIPTLSGMSVFIISYLVVSRGIADVPPALTLLTSATCFLVGLLGLSYGILSASWESAPGTLFGFENVGPNIGRVKDVFSSLNQQK